MIKKFLIIMTVMLVSFKAKADNNEPIVPVNINDIESNSEYFKFLKQRCEEISLKVFNNPESSNMISYHKRETVNDKEIDYCFIGNHKYDHLGYVVSILHDSYDYSFNNNVVYSIRLISINKSKPIPLNICNNMFIDIKKTLYKEHDPDNTNTFTQGNKITTAFIRTKKYLNLNILNITREYEPNDCDISYIIFKK